MDPGSHVRGWGEDERLRQVARAVSAPLDASREIILEVRSDSVGLWPSRCRACSPACSGHRASLFAALPSHTQELLPPHLPLGLCRSPSLPLGQLPTCLSFKVCFCLSLSLKAPPPHLIWKEVHPVVASGFFPPLAHSHLTLLAAAADPSLVLLQPLVWGPPDKWFWR